MMTFNLGVDDVSYAMFGKPSGKSSYETTGEVAEELEKNSGVMAYFISAEISKIPDMIGQAYLNYIDDEESGPQEGVVFSKDMQDQFKADIKNRIFDGKVKNAPNSMEAAGVSRYDDPTGEPLRRPHIPFHDTGMYQDCFRAWLQP
jgi:hypothetical protein